MRYSTPLCGQWYCRAALDYYDFMPDLPITSATPIVLAGRAIAGPSAAADPLLTVSADAPARRCAGGATS
jgi:hypothetical protein